MGSIFVDNLEPLSGTSLTLGASGDAINLATGATAGFGKIGQIVSTFKADAFGTTSTSLVDVTGLTLNITPSATSSKILIMLCCGVGNGAGGNNVKLVLVRGSTEVGSSTFASSSNTFAFTNTQANSDVTNI